VTIYTLPHLNCIRLIFERSSLPCINIDVRIGLTLKKKRLLDFGTSRRNDPPKFCHVIRLGLQNLSSGNLNGFILFISHKESGYFDKHPPSLGNVTKRGNSKATASCVENPTGQGRSDVM